MPFPSLTFAQLLTIATRTELEQFVSLLQGYLGTEHKEDGSHGAITADSIVTTGAATIGADVAAQASNVKLGDVIGVNSGLAGTGILSGLLLGGGTKGWVAGVKAASSPGSATDNELRLWDLKNLVAGVSALRLFYYTANARWALGVESGGAIQFGENTAGKRIAEINTDLINAVSYNGGQIPFPATQNPSADANTLDDYEEGTWTPALTFGGAAVGLTYTSRTGTYTKVGNLVTVEMRIVLSSKGSSVGASAITGLPFTTNMFPAALLDFAAGGPGALSYAALSGTSVFPLSGARAQLTDANFSGTDDFRFGITYRV